MKREIRKYFKMVKSGEIDAKKAAEKIGCSYYKFKVEYEKYYDPFVRKNSINFATVITFLSLVVALFSTVISFQMLSAERKAYDIEAQPDLNIKESIVTLYWGDDGSITYADENGIQEQLYQNFTSYAIPGVRVKNLGRNTAKDIKYDWKYTENLDDFKRAFELIGIDMEADISENRVTFTGLWDYEYSDLIRTEESSFLETGEYDYITLPTAYLRMLSKYCYEIFPADDQVDYSNFYDEDSLPQIELAISYTNILGETNEDTIAIRFRPMQYKTLDGRTGGCTFQIKTESK